MYLEGGLSAFTYVCIYICYYMQLHYQVYIFIQIRTYIFIHILWVRKWPTKNTKDSSRALYMFHFKTYIHYYVVSIYM